MHSLYLASSLLLMIAHVKCDPTVSLVTNSASHNIKLNKEHRSIAIVGDEFMVDGKRLHIVSGSLHYFRVPAVYWRDRLSTLKAAGLNSVSTYVEWSFHEPEERQYNFERDRNITEFIRIADELGLHVLLRPGPYICAERDLGGLPYWLLGKYPDIRLRTTDKNFMKESEIWFAKLFENIAPLLYGNGGPIILVQVENEYGSYGSDKQYMSQLRDIISSHVNQRALLYTTDGTYPSMFKAGSVEGALTTIDFGSGTNVKKTFKEFRRHVPHGPLMNSEYYPGWLTHWGEKMNKVGIDSVVKTLKDMLDSNINFNFYMFFGGTNFEFSAGANYNNHYEPDITSYDYDAPMNESGDPTLKYYAIREALEKYFPEVKEIPLPQLKPKGKYGLVNLTAQFDLLSQTGRSLLGKLYNATQGQSLPNFELQRQRSGLMLYEINVAAFDIEENNRLVGILKPRDRVYVFVDGKLQGSPISRMHKILSCPIKTKGNFTLSLLVESQGRINYGSKLHDNKGILSPVLLDNEALDGEWSITGFPLESLNTWSQDIKKEEIKTSKKGPVMYEGTFTLPEGTEPLDTFINPTNWGKGYIWINGNNLGRYWPSVGPQVTLYIPGAWLKASPQENHLQILELESAPDDPTIELTDVPILDRST